MAWVYISAEGAADSRRGWPGSKGRLQLESKADTRARNLPSPDRADAVLAAMLKPQTSWGFSFVRRKDAFDSAGFVLRAGETLGL